MRVRNLAGALRLMVSGEDEITSFREGASAGRWVGKLLRRPAADPLT